MRIGIIGLPNVGKSTILNVLSGAHNAAAENYPFCTVEPNCAIVPVPDDRLDRIAGLTHPEKITPTTVEFVDIAGLVKDASKGEGLGNQFLGHVGETDALLHVVRCFSEEDVAHVAGEVDPVRDVEIVETELLLRDVQLLENHVKRLSKQVRGDKSLQAQVDVGRALLEHLNAGQPAVTFDARSSEPARALYAEVRPVTDKKIVYCANVDEDGFNDANPHVQALRTAAETRGAPVMVMAARIEEELIGMNADERKEFLDSYGVDESALERMIQAGYEALNLVSFFTIQSNQVQAWTVRRGTRAPQAAGAIHSDFEKGFIRAEVLGFDDLIQHGSEAACKTAGVARTEGKDYEVRDGDIIRFYFNP